MHRGKLTGAISLNADALGLIDDALTEAKHVCDANVSGLSYVQTMTSMRRGTGAGGSDIDNFWLPLIIGPWLHQAIADVKKNAMILNVMRWQCSPSSETLDTMPPGCTYQFWNDDWGYGG